MYGTSFHPDKIVFFPFHFCRVIETSSTCPLILVSRLSCCITTWPHSDILPGACQEKFQKIPLAIDADALAYSHSGNFRKMSRLHCMSESSSSYSLMAKFFLKIVTLQCLNIIVAETAKASWSRNMEFNRILWRSVLLVCDWRGAEERHHLLTRAEVRHWDV